MQTVPSYHFWLLRTIHVSHSTAYPSRFPGLFFELSAADSQPVHPTQNVYLLQLHRPMTSTMIFSYKDRSCQYELQVYMFCKAFSFRCTGPAASHPSTSAASILLRDFMSDCCNIHVTYFVDVQGCCGGCFKVRRLTRQVLPDLRSAWLA